MTRCLLDKQLLRLEIANHRLQELQRVALQDLEELVLLKITAESDATSAARVRIELMLPGPQLRTDVQVEDIGLLAGADAWVGSQQTLDPGRTAARAAHHEQ